jgi:hypothetical protein
VRVWREWLAQRNKREMVGLVCAGIGAAAAGGWTLFKFLYQEPAKPEVTYRICVAHKGSEKNCPIDTFIIPDVGPDTVSIWARRECAKYVRIIPQGDAEPPYVVVVKCN